jgi:hypothetical protein
MNSSPKNTLKTDIFFIQPFLIKTSEKHTLIYQNNKHGLSI